MGHVRVPIKLANPDRIQETHEVDQALIDTGATWMAVPGELAREMGLRVVGQTTLHTATGPQVLDQSYVFIELQGKSMVTPVVISETYPGVIIGVITLEGLGFAVDPTSGRLIDAELLLL